VVGGAKSSEQADDHHIVVVWHELSFLCLLHTEDEDGEEDVFHPDIVGASQRPLANS